MNAFLRQSWTIAAKDLRTELRNREVLNSVGAFALVVMLLFSFAFDPISNPDSRAMSGGLLWVVYAFAGVLALNRSFGRETANDCLTALVAAPISGGAIFLGKTLANVALLIALQLISLPVFWVFYDLPLSSRPDLLFAVMLLGAWALAAIGSLFGAVTANNRLRELMLPLLVFPLVLPALIACVHLTELLLSNQELGASVGWFKLLIVFDLIFSLLGATLIDPVLSA